VTMCDLVIEHSKVVTTTYSLGKQTSCLLSLCRICPESYVEACRLGSGPTDLIAETSQDVIGSIFEFPDMRPVDPLEVDQVPVFAVQVNVCPKDHMRCVRMYPVTCDHCDP
jgi:hypothetical protein